MAINIAQLTTMITDCLPKKSIKLSAEISELTIKRHIYLTLKDNSGSINSIIWKWNISD